MAACLKHFPGHGDTVADSHLAAPVVRADADLLRARELVPFAAAVAAGAEAVMTAHVVVPALDPDGPGLDQRRGHGAAARRARLRRACSSPTPWTWPG